MPCDFADAEEGLDGGMRTCLKNGRVYGAGYGDPGSRRVALGSGGGEFRARGCEAILGGAPGPRWSRAAVDASLVSHRVRVSMRVSS